jgi:hypothetical protein
MRNIVMIINKITPLVALCSALNAGIAMGQIVNQAANDVIVLRAEEIGTLSAGAASDIAKEKCAKRTNRGQRRWLDCTSALEEKFGAPGVYGAFIQDDPQISCKIMLLKVVARRVAVESSLGIGFAFGRRGAANRLTFHPSKELRKSGTLPLPGGAFGDIYDFVGISSCQKGLTVQRFQFRPFLGFGTGLGDKFRNWDAFGFYEIPGGKPGFDQSTILGERFRDQSTLENAESLGQREVLSDVDGADGGAGMVLGI